MYLVLPFLIIVIIVLNLPSADAKEEYYIYIDELPAWADYAGNVMYDSTKAWEDANPGLKFYIVEDEQDADFVVQWVKDFGVDHIGYAYGNQFIEVGLGDSNCFDKWRPYSANYVADIMKHEIGHIFGNEHSDDPDSIMYPTALNLEYGIEEDDYVLTSGYYQFVATCSLKEITSYSFQVTTSDPNYGVDIYFVPSIKEFDKYDKGESFRYYSNDECFVKNHLSFGGTCRNVKQGSGLLIIMPDQSTEPLTTVSVTMQETTSQKPQIIKEPKSEPQAIFEPADSVIPSREYLVFESSQFGFSMEYPSNWFVDDEIIGEEGWNGIVGFTPSNDWTTQIIVGYGVNDHLLIGLTGNSYLHALDEMLKDWCSETSYDSDGFICNNYAAMNKREISINGIDAYQIEYTFQKHIPDGYILQTITRQVEIPIGKNVWQIFVEAPKNQWNNYKIGLVNAINSFQASNLIELANSMPSFFDLNKDPWSYVKRYQNEPEYKEWFDRNYSAYTIYEAVGLKEPVDFVDPKKDPQYYVNRYFNEPEYKEWFDRNYSAYTIYEAVGLKEPEKKQNEESVEPEEIPQSKIPDWVKNTMKWYVEGQISEDELINALQFLIKEGIIKV